MILSIAVSFLVGVANASAPQESKSVEVMLDSSAPPLSFTSGDDFYDVCAQIRIPCGEERLPESTTTTVRASTFRPGNLTLRVILDSLVRDDPRYIWSLQDGVLIIRPKTLPSASILDKRIVDFERRQQTFDGIAGDVARTAWIRIATSGTGTHAMAMNDPRDTTYDKKIDIKCAGATIRDILDVAAKTHGHAMWIYTYPPPSSFIPRFLRRGSLQSVTY